MVDEQKSEKVSVETYSHNQGIDPKGLTGIFYTSGKNAVQQYSINKGKNLDEVKIINSKSEGRDREQVRKDYTNL